MILGIRGSFSGRGGDEVDKASAARGGASGRGVRGGRGAPSPDARRRVVRDDSNVRARGPAPTRGRSQGTAWHLCPPSGCTRDRALCTNPIKILGLCQEYRFRVDSSASVDAAHPPGSGDRRVRRLTVGSRSLRPGVAEVLTLSLARPGPRPEQSRAGTPAAHSLVRRSGTAPVPRGSGLPLSPEPVAARPGFEFRPRS